MSQHSSLKSSARAKRHRSVLKKYERIEKLAEEDKWDESKSIYGLPKVKMVRFKVKKVKAAEEVEEGAVAAEGAPAGEGAPAAPAEGKSGEAKAEKKPEAKQK